MFARTKRYAAAYTHREPSRDDELKALLTWITTQPGAGLTIVGPGVDNLRHSALASALVERGVASYYSARQLSTNIYDKQRVIALWPSVKLLGRIDDEAHALTALAVLPWLLSDVAQWTATRQAVDLLGIAPTSPPPTIADPVVLGAMRSLTDGINLSSGLTHPLDWDRAVNIFRLLAERHFTWDPLEIERWAAANGWDTTDARELADIALAYASGRTKRLKARSAPIAPAIIDHWRERGLAAWTPTV